MREKRSGRKGGKKEGRRGREREGGVKYGRRGRNGKEEREGGGRG